jgi:Protein-L-isoaspartate carboxylmethyltransferase
MVAVVGRNPIMTAYRITRTSAASFDTVGLFDTVIKPLRGTAISQFKF